MPIKSDLMELLPEMVLFVAVAKTRSISGAARALAMPLATVSRRLATLEQRLGLQLLTRTTRKVELTEAGARYFERCRAILEAAEAAHDELNDQLENPRGHLRVSATADFALTFLTPLFAEFAQRYTGISFSFDLTPRSVDLVAESIDVAIRMGALPDSQLTTRKLGAARGGIYAAPSYLAGAGRLQAPADLGHHQCLLVLRVGDEVTHWTLLRGNETVRIAVAGRFVANNIRLLLQLATLGLGVAVLDCKLAQPEVDAGRLVRVLPEWSPPPVPVHALTPSRLLPAKTRLFLDCLSQHLQGLAD
jgi:DNA-binding transcriptional LysR family regulator